MSEKILYLECYSGISGDMTVAALLDLGAREEKLREALEALNIGGYEIRIGRTAKCGINACDFEVLLDGDAGSHDEQAGHGCHDAHVHGDHVHEEVHVHGDHAHEEVHVHGDHVHEEMHVHGNHSHEESHVQMHHTHEHRTYRDICRILEEAPLDAQVRVLAEKMFLYVARAEAKVHGKPMEEVHFREVGAVDSIVDIVGAAACIADLGIRQVCVSTLYEGTGTVWCQHGRIPVPAPAVAEIVSAAGLPVRITQTEGEMVTPTGAAIAAAIRTLDNLPAAFTVEKIGIGAGKKDFPHANILRAMIIRESGRGNGAGRTGERPGEEEEWSEKAGEVSEEAAPDRQREEKNFGADSALASDEICILETNIDDCSGEQLAYTMECLMETGARDASCFPVFMKKNRPAWMLQVLCTEEKIPEMESVIFRETTSIGLRKYREKRQILPRKIEKIRTVLGPADIKVCVHKGQRFYYPEYASIHEICRNTGKSYREVYGYLSSEAARQIGSEESVHGRDLPV
ncbi:MAG: nickel pincer cofactor biosynthesis protein LarC [Candidatus Limivivens sp.]|nr:nickel pincer cofactor biosynthesis protein LarC [Candidatus Limivivens sp.]